MLNLVLPSPVKPRSGTEFPELIRKHQECRLKISMREPVEEDSLGSMGCQYVLNAARAAGFRIDYLSPDDDASGYDVELVSVHHCTDFPRLKEMPKRGRLRIVGGHPTTNNIRPAIPFADVFCIGEGETWIVHALSRLNDGASVEALADLPGTIIPATWEQGQEVPRGNTEMPLPKHPPYLNRSGEGHARVWYIEMARGCPFTCHYCELGWAWKYRPQDTGWLLEQVDACDKKQSNKISLFAPDEASHPGYGDILERIHQRGFVTSFGSMRLDVIVKKNLPFKNNMLIRVGLDGITEATRYRVGRKISDEAVYDYFKFMSDRGHATFKVFVVFGYPWETEADFDEFEQLWDRIARLHRKVNARVRFKFTPLIPQPSTPLGDTHPSYHVGLAGRIRKWFERVGRPWSRPGWFVVNDGLMGPRSHALQCRLTLGDESTLAGDTDWSYAETLKGYEIFE